MPYGCALSFQPCNALNVHLLTSHAVCCSPRNNLPCPSCMPDQLHMCRKSREVWDMPKEQESFVRPKFCMWTARMLVFIVLMIS